MRPTTSFAHLALAVSSLVQLTGAWPEWLPAIDSLIVRAEAGSSASHASSLSSTTPTGEASSDSDGKPSKTSSATNGKTSKHPKATHTEFAPDAPPGAVVMTQPATTAAGTALYRISDYVTFGWNYTSLLGRPDGIDVLLSCSTASATWTLTSNMTFATAASFVWDTKDQADSVESPLPVAEYTLIIKDSAAEITDAPEPGYLGANSGFTFGLYTNQPYSNLSDWKCPGGCSSAPSLINGQALILVIGTSVITVLSFSWFVFGTGLQ